jgi:hypothetical protein
LAALIAVALLPAAALSQPATKAFAVPAPAQTLSLSAGDTVTVTTSYTGGSGMFDIIYEWNGYYDSEFAVRYSDDVLAVTDWGFLGNTAQIVGAAVGESWSSYYDLHREIWGPNPEDCDTYWGVPANAGYFSNYFCEEGYYGFGEPTGDLCYVTFTAASDIELSVYQGDYNDVYSAVAYPNGQGAGISNPPLAPMIFFSDEDTSLWGEPSVTGNIINSVSVNAGGTDPGDGDDPEADLTITTPAELAAFRDAVNGGNDYDEMLVVLANDIDLSTDASTATWTSIGTFLNPFNGVFDGQGHTVSGLYMQTSGMGEYATPKYSGLFGRVGDTIQNLSVAGTIESTATGVFTYTGGVVAHAIGISSDNDNWDPSPGNPYIADRNPVVLRNLRSAVSITAATGRTGGVVGESVGGYHAYAEDPDWEDYTEDAYPSRIESCANTGSINGSPSGSHYLGGVVGSAQGTDIRDCYNSGELSFSAASGSFFIGGVIGQFNWSDTLANSFSVGAISHPAITTNQQHAEGLAGMAEGAIANSFYLDTSFSGTAVGVTAKTAGELASPEFLALINDGGDAFVAGTAHPILSWEADDDGTVEPLTGAPGSGDFNGDTFTTLDEALLLVQIINTDSFDALSAGQFAAMDINADGFLTMADVLMIVQIILNA